MKGHIFTVIIIAAALGFIHAVKFVYNYYKLEEEVLDLRKRLGR